MEYEDETRGPCPYPLFTPRETWEIGQVNDGKNPKKFTLVELRSEITETIERSRKRG